MARSTVVIDLARDATLSRDLAAGGVFVRGYALRIAEECELVVCGVNRRVSLPARVVYVDEKRGAGLELIGFSTAMRAQLAELAASNAAHDEDDLALPTDCVIELSGDIDDDDLAVPVSHDDDHHRTVPVATPALRSVALPLPLPAPREHEFDGFADSDAAADAGDEFASVEADTVFPGEPDEFDDAVDRGGPVPMRAGDAAAARNDFADGDEPVAISAGDAASRGNDFADDSPSSDGSEPVPMQVGDAAASLYNDFADDSAATTDEPAGARGGEPIGQPASEPGDDIDAAFDAAFGVAPAVAPHALHANAANGAPHANDAPHANGAPHANDDDDEPEDTAGRLAAGGRAARNVHERLRGLTLAAQIKAATNGELHERIVLERLYGKNVWETLLRNPRLTAPEVSRIARYGSLPRVLLEVILANNAWLQVPEVRRALLSNPRLGTDQIMKVLRLTPKHELRMAAIQTAYPHAVRNAAKMMLKSD